MKRLIKLTTSCRTVWQRCYKSFLVLFILFSAGATFLITPDLNASIINYIQVGENGGQGDTGVGGVGGKGGGQWYMLPGHTSRTKKGQNGATGGTGGTGGKGGAGLVTIDTEINNMGTLRIGGRQGEQGIAGAAGTNGFRGGNSGALEIFPGLPGEGPSGGRGGWLDHPEGGNGLDGTGSGGGGAAGAWYLDGSSPEGGMGGNGATGNGGTGSTGVTGASRSMTLTDTGEWHQLLKNSGVPLGFTVQVGGNGGKGGQGGQGGQGGGGRGGEGGWLVTPGHPGGAGGAGGAGGTGGAGGKGTVVIAGQGRFDNSGTTYVDTGSALNINQGGSLTNRFRIQNRGTLTNAGTLDNTGHITGDGTYRQTSGKTQINGTMAQSVVNIQGGSLTGVGTITGSTTIGDGAVLAPGNSPGTLTIDGDLNLESGSTTWMEIGGIFSGAYDILDISGTATLGGILDIDLFDWTDDGIDNPFMPKAGDVFDIITAETLSGAFDFLDFATLGNSLIWSLQYLTDEIGSTDVVRLSVLQGASPVPEPSTFLLLGIGLLCAVRIARQDCH